MYGMMADAFTDINEAGVSWGKNLKWNWSK